MRYDILEFNEKDTSPDMVKSSDIVLVFELNEDKTYLTAKLYRFKDKEIAPDYSYSKFLVMKEDGKYETYEEAKLVFELTMR